MSTVKATVHLRIEGRVQGVGYRAWLAGAARRLNLAGWVRNRRDGSVEAVVSGPPADVERVVSACDGGPPAAAVTSIERREACAGDLSGGFEVRDTA
jgi:acylphosphatase